MLTRSAVSKAPTWLALRPTAWAVPSAPTCVADRAATCSLVKAEIWVVLRPAMMLVDSFAISAVSKAAICVAPIPADCVALSTPTCAVVRATI